MPDARRPLLPGTLVARAALAPAALVAVLLAAAATAQNAPPEGGRPPANGSASPSAPPPGAPVSVPAVRTERPAIVNGESITTEDIRSYAQFLGQERPDLSPVEALHLARRSVAEEILLAAEMVRLGVVLDDRMVDEYWLRRRGVVPDYDAIAAQTGTKAERQRLLALRAALAELYLLHRVGLRTELVQQIAPDPLMVRLVTITPSQLREAFAANRRAFDTPDTVDCDVFVCTDEASAKLVLDALAPGGPASPVEPLHRSYPLPKLPELFPQDVVAFLAEAPPGTTRTFVVPEGTLVVEVTGRQSGKPATFADSQEKLRRKLQNELLTEARRHLVATLAQHATFWPTDLFAEHPSALPPGAPAGTPAPGTTTAVPSDAPPAADAPAPTPTSAGGPNTGP